MSRIKLVELDPATGKIPAIFLAGSSIQGLGNLGSSKTISFAGASTTLVTGILNAAVCTLTLTGLAAGCSATLELSQDNVGSHTLVWPSAVKWPGGSAPTLSTTAGRLDIVKLYSLDGTLMRGSLAGLAFA